MIFFLSSDTTSDHLPATDHREKNMSKREPKRRGENFCSVLHILWEKRLRELGWKKSPQCTLPGLKGIRWKSTNSVSHSQKDSSSSPKGFNIPLEVLQSIETNFIEPAVFWQNFLFWLTILSILWKAGVMLISRLAVVLVLSLPCVVLNTDTGHHIHGSRQHSPGIHPAVQPRNHPTLSPL